MVRTFSPPFPLLDDHVARERIAQRLKHTPSAMCRGIYELDKKCLTGSSGTIILFLSPAMRTTGRYRPVSLTQKVILKSRQIYPAIAGSPSIAEFLSYCSLQLFQPLKETSQRQLKLCYFDYPHCLKCASYKGMSQPNQSWVFETCSLLNYL